VNLGEPINTRGEEKTPFISKDGTTLYFASDELPGYGGYDLFKSVRGPDGWSPPVNLGRPINSSGDDMFFTESASRDTVYIASNRDGGYGNLDIYMIYTQAPPPPPPEPEPLVLRYTIRNAFTMEPLAASVGINADAEQESDLRAGVDGKVERRITPGKEYAVVATHPGFLNGMETVFYPLDETGLKERQLLLVPFSEEERTIYSFVVEFDFDLFNIRPEERKHLDSAAVLLTQFPHSTVVVSGHTDSMGTDIYNIKLGYNRAKQVSEYVVKYLKEKKVTLKNPMEIRTYGETQPIATNSTDEGRQRNRRVAIAIVRNK
jgi:outer membrane protein OmpA-like peptidoglycan-associated protein